MAKQGWGGNNAQAGRSIGKGMDEQSPEKLCRRDLLKVIAGSLSAAALPVPLRAKTWLPARLFPRSAELAAPYRPNFFSAEEMETLDALSEAIIPADDHSPGASAAKVNQYIDVVVAESNSKNKSFWQDGIAALDKMAARAGYESFGHCSPPQRDSLLAKLSEQEDHPKTLEERFFVAAKEATIDGFYTSAIGIHEDLQYKGNTYLLHFDGCQHDEHKS